MLNYGSRVGEYQLEEYYPKPDREVKVKNESFFLESSQSKLSQKSQANSQNQTVK